MEEEWSQPSLSHSFLLRCTLAEKAGDRRLASTRKKRLELSSRLKLIASFAGTVHAGRGAGHPEVAPPSALCSAGGSRRVEMHTAHLWRKVVASSLCYER